MKFRWLLADELRHLVRSRAVILVLGSLPLLLAAGLMQTGDQAAKTLLFLTFMGSNLGGIVCGATVTASCVADMQQGTPVLFAVRPIPRYYLLLTRFLAMVLLLALTMAGAIVIATAALHWLHPMYANLATTAGEGLTLTAANALLQGSLGVLLGVYVTNMLPAVILNIFLGINLGNGLAYLMLENTTLPPQDPWMRMALTLGSSLLLAFVLLWLATRKFARKPL